MEQQQTESLFELQIDPAISRYLSETARWTKFLSIVGFIGCALIMLIAVFMGAFWSSFMGLTGTDGPAFAMGGTVLMVVYVLIALLYFFPCLYLFRFSSRMQVALVNNDQVALTTAFQNLKSCFKFIGILTIIVLAFWILALLIQLLAVAR
ncbi:MAG: DUF5362 family protein [Chitinophagaceae bacterium]